MMTNGFTGRIRIELVDSLEAFAELRGAWDRVYAADPEAQFFLSWTWMSRWLRGVKDHWLVLAAKTSDHPAAYVGFFPLRRRVRQGRNEITMGGNRAADYTGFICVPQYSSDTIPAFARYVSRLDWAVLNMEFFRASADRLRLFLDHFPRERFAHRSLDGFYEGSTENVCICPCIELPPTWDAYLQGRLSSNTRQKVRRFLRKIDNHEEFRMTHSSSATIAGDLTILLDLWTSKWGERKGTRLDSVHKIVRSMLMHCAAKGALFLPVLWRGQTPLAASAILVDHQKKSLLFYLGGRDQTVRDMSPGFVLHAYSIRYAISRGFARYDFLRGNENYKYQFAAEEFHIRHIVITRKNGASLSKSNSLSSQPVDLAQL